MDTNLFTIALLLPLVGFLINCFFGKSLGKTMVGILSTSTVGIAFALIVTQFLAVINDASPTKDVWFDWIQILNYSIDFGFYYDQLSILWLLFVTGIGTLIHL